MIGWRLLIWMFRAFLHINLPQPLGDSFSTLLLSGRDKDKMRKMKREHHIKRIKHWKEKEKKNKSWESVKFFGKFLQEYAYWCVIHYPFLEMRILGMVMMMGFVLLSFSKMQLKQSHNWHLDYTFLKRTLCWGFMSFKDSWELIINHGTWVIFTITWTKSQWKSSVDTLVINGL